MPNFEDENPFADPSVQNAVKTTTKDNIGEYNPFDGKNAPTSSAANKTAEELGEPAVMNPTPDPPKYTPSGHQNLAADFQKRQEELDRRAEEISRREEELRNATHNVRQNNWPPLPSFVPLQPCFYQDINVDIPVEFQRMVRHLYYLWVYHAALLLANMLVSMLYLFCNGDSGQTFGLALVYWFLFTPASFVCWFRPAYKAFRDDSSLYFMIFFFVFFFQFMVTCLYALGIGSMGASGLILGVKSLGLSGSLTFVGVLMIIIGVGFGVAAFGDFYMLVRIHRLYRSTGASVAKAQAEFTSSVMKNEHVREAAAQAARETVRSQFAASTSQQPGGQSAGNRY